MALNNLGEDVGEADTASGRRHAFLWRNGEMIDLTPQFSSWWSTGWDLNNHAEVVINTAPERAFVWRDGELIELRTAHAVLRSFAAAINDHCEVVGSALVGPGKLHSVLLSPEGVVEDLYDRTGTVSLRVDDINNSGIMAGAMSTEQGGRAVMILDESVFELGDLGGQHSGAECINEVNQIVGRSERAPGGSSIFYPFYWELGKMIDITLLVGRVAVGGSHGPMLNNCGEVLLHGDGPSRGVDFFWYKQGEPLRPLWGLTRPHTEWQWLSPNKINDRGQIVGYGAINGAHKPFLISPIPGDLDGDGDADVRDFAIFVQRFSGSLLPALPTCERADFDGDADVDLGDHEIFNSNFSGPK